MIGLSGLLAAYYIGRPLAGFFLIEAKGARSSEFLFFLLGVFCALAICVAASLYLWRLVLVHLGVLTPDEAKGYPFSRPWER